MTDCIVPDPWQALRHCTPARIALGRAGDSLPTHELLAFGLAHAQARDAVHAALDPAALARDLEQAGFAWVAVHSAATDRSEFLRRPDLGRRLDPASREQLAQTRQAPAELVFVAADGLSARAVHLHAVALLAQVRPLLPGWRVGPVVIAEQSRVALADEIGELLRSKLVAILIGERPGLSSPHSLGVYLTYEPRVGRTDAERNCISNIRPEGLRYADAAHMLRQLLEGARQARLSGVHLKMEGAASIGSAAG